MVSPNLSRDQQPATKTKSTTLDEAVRLTGVGLFHWLLVIVTGMCSASAVAEIVSPSYLLSPAAWAPCDLAMDITDKTLLSAIVFVGMLMGTHLWGVAADSWGRVPLLRMTLLGDAIVGVISSLLPDKRLFIAARFFNGFLVAGSTSSAMTYLGEFHSETSRGKAMVVLGLFPGGCTLLVAALAYLVLPLQLSWQLPWGAPFRSWRLFVMLNAMPSLLTGLALLWFPESPPFLLATGQPERALQSLRTVHALNKGRKQEYPVTSLTPPLEVPADNAGKGNRLLAIWRQTKPLFCREYIRNTLLMCTILFSVISGANGLLVWMPEIFNRMATFSLLQPEREATACEAIYDLQEVRQNATGSTMTKAAQRLLECGGVLPDDMFINTGIIGMANILVGIFGAFAINWLGKRNLLVGSLLLAGLCGILITFIPSSVATLSLASGTISLTSTCISVVVSMAVENYPTVLRATAMSLGMLAGRAGSMTGSLVFGALLDSQCSGTFWGFGGLLALCGVLALMLPRRGKFAT